METRKSALGVAEYKKAFLRRSTGELLWLWVTGGQHLMSGMFYYEDGSEEYIPGGDLVGPLSHLELLALQLK